jgi:hypothetical protein
VPVIRNNTLKPRGLCNRRGAQVVNLTIQPGKTADVTDLELSTLKLNLTIKDMFRTNMLSEVKPEVVPGRRPKPEPVAVAPVESEHEEKLKAEPGKKKSGKKKRGKDNFGLDD